MPAHAAPDSWQLGLRRTPGHSRGSPLADRAGGAAAGADRRPIAPGPSRGSSARCGRPDRNAGRWAAGTTWAAAGELDGDEDVAAVEDVTKLHRPPKT